MTEQEFEYDPDVEEVDVDVYIGDPEFEDAPSKQTDEPGGQDDGELPPYAGGSDA
jgi:hypothetical protein